MPKINSLEVVHQDTNKDSYQNLHDILVALNKSLALEKEVVDDNARASIENLLEMYVNDKEAFLRSLQTLTTEFKESQAQYSQEILLKASELEALARKTTTLSASVATANANIATEQYIRATEDEALATQITTLSATVGSKNRTYYQSSAPSSGMVSGDLWIDSDDDKLYRYNGSSWVNVQDNQIGVNTAAISSEATTRATADSANATAINAVTARLDTGDFATVKTTSEASALKLQTRANLVSEISNWALPASMVLTQGGVWGMAATGNGSGTYVAESPFFDVAAGQTYTITGDSLNFNSSGNVYFDILFFNSSNVVVKDGAQNPISGVHDFSATDSNRNAHAVVDTAPATAVKAKARFVVVSGTGSAVGFRQVKVERGGLPATPFSQEATVNYASAKWGVTVDANGNAAGIALMADSTGTSEFVVAANKFRVKKPDGTDGIAWNGTNSRLDIAGDVYANAFYGNVIGTGNVNSSAVTNAGAVSASSNDVSLTLTVSGVTGESYILMIIAQWPQTYYATTNITINGTSIRTATPLAGNEGSLMVTYTVTPGTYTIRSYNSDTRNAYMALYAQVLKR